MKSSLEALQNTVAALKMDSNTFVERERLANGVRNRFSGRYALLTLLQKPLEETQSTLYLGGRINSALTNPCNSPFFFFAVLPVSYHWPTRKCRHSIPLASPIVLICLNSSN